MKGTTAPAATVRTTAGTRASPQSSCDWLIDNSDAYNALLSAIDSARRTVSIMQLALDPDCIAYDNASSTHRVLVDALADAAQRRAVDVQILLNASLLLDTAKPLRRFFAKAGLTRIEVRGVSHFPQLLHAKIVIVDGAVAFLVGSPFVNGYWDDSSHAPSDDRRPLRELGGRPLHDVSVRLTGPAVRGLLQLFNDLWGDADPRVPAVQAVTPRTIAAAPVSDGGMRVVTSVPKGLLRAEPGGRTDILPACVDALSAARRLVYIEHQYLSASVIVDALVDALDREPCLEIIVVLNQNPDVTAYRTWQNARLESAGLLSHPRVGLFALWTSTRGIGGVRTSLSQIFVHSKVLLVDDTHAIVGSANMDGVSLRSYGEDFQGWLGRRVFDGVRNVDVCVALDGSDNANTRATIADLRQRLWREHLGADFAAKDKRPEEGWLPLWRRSGARNAEALDAGAPAPGRVLRYSTRPTPRQQLRDVGIDPAHALDVRFNPSWLEVRFSPNWIRNMWS